MRWQVCVSILPLSHTSLGDILLHSDVTKSDLCRQQLDRDAWSSSRELGTSGISQPAAVKTTLPLDYSPQTRRFGLLVNQRAGKFARLGKARLARLIQGLNLSHHTNIMYCDGTSLARNARHLAHAGVDAVAVYGGDGSARSVVEALSDFNIPVLPLPGGTLNRLCHLVHGHAHLEPILAKLAQAKSIWLSGGRANEHLFLVASGFGPWMAFERVREIARISGLKAGLASLRDTGHNLFGGQLTVQGLTSDVDIIVAAPGHVDRAFGLSHECGAPDHGLEMVTAQLNSPLKALELGMHVLTKSWRNLANVNVVTGQHMGVIGLADAKDTRVAPQIYGLVDGEICFMGPHVQLTYHPRAALMLTTR